MFSSNLQIKSGHKNYGSTGSATCSSKINGEMGMVLNELC